MDRTLLIKCVLRLIIHVVRACFDVFGNKGYFLGVVAAVYMFSGTLNYYLWVPILAFLVTIGNLLKFVTAKIYCKKFNKMNIIITESRSLVLSTGQPLA